MGRVEPGSGSYVLSRSAEGVAVERGHPGRLLYAEDNPADGDLTREHFVSHAPDIQVDVVKSGRECLAHLQHGDYDVLLLDNHLPDMEGVDVLRAMPALDVLLPVVVVTSVGDEDLVVRVLRLGAWDYVAKDGDYIQRLPTIVRNAVADYGRLRDRGHAVRRGQRRVLYIERHDPDIDLTARQFADHAPHFSLEIVRSSTEALARLERASFDLVLTDLRMPDMNALDLLREFRRRALSIPVVVVTGKGDEMAAVASLRLGAYDYIVKRDDYLTQLPYAVDNAIDRFQLGELNDRLHAELAERGRTEAERSQLADQLRQAQKIDSIGLLAGGVAHDFNNLLMVIQGHAELMLQELPEDGPLRESVNEIREASMRAADLTRQLLAFSRRQLLHPRVLDLNSAVGESAKMLRRLLGEAVELVTVLDPALGRVTADPGQLDQVIVNLAINARDAMPRGGRLTIETRNVTVDEGDAQRHASFRPGSYVLLAISDTGVGIRPEILSRIFEPFFTTKEQGKGTGLGLSMVYGIVKQSGGWIWVSSEPGIGTTFKIYLPRVDAPVTNAENIRVEVQNPRGNETVLVVEDDETVRKLTCHGLRRYGYQVIEAASGDEALAAAASREVPLPLLVTDVVTPGISGPELATQLQRLRPEMKVLYTSGYTDDAAIQHGLRHQTMSLLQKPFTPSELARRVREMLDQP